MTPPSSDAALWMEGHLRAREVLARDDRVVDAIELAGGVSGTVYRLRTGRGRELVLKQALDRLKVAQDWRSDPARAQNEARALRMFSTITPDHVPELVDIDPATNIVVMTAAPGEWRPWNRVLLDDTAGPTGHDTTIAVTLGRTLGAWHRLTTSDKAVVESFREGPEFRELRIEPFYEAIRSQHFECKPTIDRCIAELEHDQTAVVHGDFSPKNVLVAAGGEANVWVIDYEVAHAGPPVFDVAFFTSHLLMKALHRPARAKRFLNLRSRFLAEYNLELSAAMSGALGSLGAHTACLLLARVDGISRTAYLSESDRLTIRALAVHVLASSDPEGTFSDILRTFPKTPTHKGRG